MIVDCHTHIWSSVEQLGKGGPAYLRRQAGRESPQASPADHVQAAKCVAKTLVFGLRCASNDANVPNDFIARHVAGNVGKMYGVGAVDPNDDDATDQAEELLSRKEFCGLTVSPAFQDFHPADSRAMKIYEIADQRKRPVFFCQGTHFLPCGRMDFARPALLDEIAREFPSLRIVVSSLGHPWIEECIALLGKHPNVYADVAGLIRRPWQTYNALVLAHQFNVMDKLLFGSDFPFFTAASAVEGLYRLGEVTQGTNLPAVPREALRSVVERPSLAVLGIESGSEENAPGAQDEELT